MIKQFAQGYVAPGEKLGTAATFGIGGLAGIITVYVILSYTKRATKADSGRYVTQPLDVIKTR